jgi:sugar/nucleoside kinase (ribokinase family)
LAVSCVVVGAVCEDIIRGRGPAKREIGGTAYYFSAAISALGARAGCVAKAEDDWMMERIKGAGVPTEGISHGKSCCFELSYRRGERSLRILRHSSKIEVEDVPAQMLSYSGLHLGPVEEELGESIWKLRNRFDFISLDIQGLARTFRGRGGEVSIQGPLGERSIEALGASDVVKFSREEALELIGPEPKWGDGAARLGKLGPATVIITLGPEGALLFEDGAKTHIPPYPSDPLDWTGAGDCFMAGFDFVRLSGGNSVEAANFGSALAACVIESPRPISFPDPVGVRAKMTSPG